MSQMNWSSERSNGLPEVLSVVIGIVGSHRLKYTELLAKREWIALSSDLGVSSIKVLYALLRDDLDLDIMPCSVRLYPLVSVAAPAVHLGEG